MRYLIVILVAVILACKGSNPENANTKGILEQKKTNPNTAKEVLAQDKTNSNEIDIPICDSENRDKDLYAVFAQLSDLTFANELGGRLYYGYKKKIFDELFLSDKINCIVPISGGGYRIFDVYYNDDIVAETIYERVIAINQKLTNEDIYNDFFKSGLLFILNNQSNKLTMVSFNPFVNNNLPNEIKRFFKDDSKFDQVCMIIGMGQIEILVQ